MDSTRPWSRTVREWLQGWFHSCPRDRYELSDGKLVHCRGNQPCETVDPSEIDSWWIERERVHDVVHIRLRCGRVLDWCDREFDLLPLLTTCGVATPQEPARAEQVDQLS